MKITTLGWLSTIAAAALACGGCAARVEMVSPVATAEHPRVIELYMATMIAPRTHFIANGTFVAREEYPPVSHFTGRYDDLPTLQFRQQPSPARWAAFWRAVDRLQLSAWRREYAQSDLPPGRGVERIYTTDGANWIARFSIPGRRQESRGDGAFPSAGRPARTTTASRNGVFALEDAFEQLLK